MFGFNQATVCRARLSLNQKKLHTIPYQGSAIFMCWFNRRGKHMCWGLFLIKLQAFNLATLLKRNSNTGGSCGIAKFLRTSFFIERFNVCVWESYHSRVKSAWVSVLWFRASTSFRFWSKVYTERCTNSFLLSGDKIISSLLEVIDHVLSISKYVLEKQLLSILMKNVHKALHK